MRIDPKQALVGLELELYQRQGFWIENGHEVPLVQQYYASVHVLTSIREFLASYSYAPLREPVEKEGKMKPSATD